MALFGRPSAEDEQRAEAWGDWLRNRDPLAIACLVLGVFSFIELGAILLFGVVSIALGFIALRKLPAQGPPFGRRLSVAGILLSAVSLGIAGVIYLMPRHPH